MITKKKVVIPILLISSLMCSCSKKSVNTEDLNKTVLEISNYSSNKESGVETDASNINDAVIKNIDKLLELKSNSDISDVILTNDEEFNDMVYQISQAIIDKYCNDHYSDEYNLDEEETVLSEEDIQKENERIEESSKYNALIKELTDRINEIDSLDKGNIDEYIGEVEDINNVFNTLPEYYRPNVLNKSKLFEALEEVKSLKASLSAETSEETSEGADGTSEAVEETSEVVSETTEAELETSESIEETTELETETADVSSLETVGNVEDSLSESSEVESEDETLESEASEVENEAESVDGESENTESEAETLESELAESNSNGYLDYLKIIPESWLDDVIDNGPFDVEIDTKKLYEDIASLNEYLRVDENGLVLDRKALDNENHICTIKFGDGLVLYVEETVYKVNKYDSVKDYIYWDDNSFKVRCVDSNGDDVTFMGYYDKNGDVNITSGLEGLVKENVVTIYFELS